MTKFREEQSRLKKMEKETREKEEEEAVLRVQAHTSNDKQEFEE